MVLGNKKEYDMNIDKKEKEKDDGVKGIEPLLFSEYDKSRQEKRRKEKLGDTRYPVALRDTIDGKGKNPKTEKKRDNQKGEYLMFENPLIITEISLWHKERFEPLFIPFQ
jgi:hypothetical protein